MNEIIEKENVKIEDMIYEIRGNQVMLDSDLARLYECTNGTKDVNKAVNRNINRFPSDFYFQLTSEEYEILKFQFGTSRLSTHGGVRKLPYVFTEQGVAMLATVLRTDVASQVSVEIMRAFVSMRNYMSPNFIEQKYINNIVLEDHELIKENKENIKLLQKSLDKLSEKRKDNEIFFANQNLDAYVAVIKIFNKAKKSLVIVDPYADVTLLDIIKRINVSVIIITKPKNLLTKQDINKYNEQYHNLKVVYDNSFHDRFFIIDDISVYHCGASINKIGSKTFAINLIGIDSASKAIINEANEIIKKEGNYNE